ncbi:MAG: nucleoside deaminase [Clostridia bacterium]|nr:nucleoside deaminase [Clostridia bacterium]
MTHRELMTRAIELAKQAASEGEVPVGAVIARDGEIIAEGRNMREKGKNALYHAEIIAIDNACKTLDSWRLEDCVLYVTLEPCPMCTGAIINSRISKVVYGAYDLKAGSVDSVINLFSLPYNHRPELQEGFMENECRQLLTDFFSDIRLTP